MNFIRLKQKNKHIGAANYSGRRFTLPIRIRLAFALRVLFFVIVTCLSLNGWSAIIPATSTAKTTQILQSNLTFLNTGWNGATSRAERKKVKMDYGRRLENTLPCRQDRYRLNTQLAPDNQSFDAVAQRYLANTGDTTVGVTYTLVAPGDGAG